MPKAAIELDLYGPDDEKIKTLKRLIVPWGILKKAVRLTKNIGTGEDVTEENIDEIAGLVIEIFGEANVTREELDQCTDVGDMLAVINAIANRGRGLIPNAPPAAK
jgi:hypothetical protein